MGLFDKAKELASQAAAQAQEVASQKVDEAIKASSDKAEQRQAEKELSKTFKETRRFGDLSIDSKNQLLKIRGATTKLEKKGSAVGKATLAMMTAGMSLAAEAATKPRDMIVPFSDVRGYSVIQDEDEISGGTLGAAAVGAMLLGKTGAMIGAMGASRKSKKVINSMALRVDLSSFDMPCAIVTYIGKPTKTKSGDYQKAVSSMQEAMSCLDLIVSMK